MRSSLICLPGGAEPQRAFAWLDSAVFTGDPPLFVQVGDKEVPLLEVYPAWTPGRVSVTFTWDWIKGERLARSWPRFYGEIGHTLFYQNMRHQIAILDKNELQKEEDICNKFAELLLSIIEG